MFKVMVARSLSRVRRLWTGRPSSVRFGVLDRHPAGNEYLTGDYSIADIANWAWVRPHSWSGVSIDALPHLQCWLKAIGERPAVQRGIDKPPMHLDAREDSETAKKFSEEARKMVEMGMSRPTASAS